MSESKVLSQLRATQLKADFNLDGTQYESVQNIGTGAYGVVCKAIHTPSGTHVAIKKIGSAFANHTLVKRTLREVRILRHFRHENIVAVMHMFSRAGSQAADIYMVMDLMETDLHQIIHSSQPLTDQHYQYFLYQILRGLKYIHTAGVVHRDLKPSNLLINADCLLKIGDFGMARSVSNEATNNSTRPMTQYVATRWYRAPELLCSVVDYGCAVDLWSVGCILAEMVMRRQLFPGKNPCSQVKMIVFYMGTPPDEFIARIRSPIVKQWIASCGERTPLQPQAMLPKASGPALDLCMRLLTVCPWERVTTEQALQHEYLSTYHDERYEESCPSKVMVETDMIERLSGNDISVELEKEIALYSEEMSEVSGDKHPMITDGRVQDELGRRAMLRERRAQGEILTDDERSILATWDEEEGVEASVIHVLADSLQ